MNTKDKMQYFKGLLMIALIVALSGCKDFKYDTYPVTDKPYVDRTSVDLFLGTDQALASIQLTSSPANRKYTWTSQNSAVATVTQNGLVTATGEGYTNIVVSSEDDYFTVSVHVQQWVPVESITLDIPSGIVLKYWFGVIDKFKINALYAPANTTEKDLIEWTTSDPEIATVTNEGWVIYRDTGKVVITAKAKVTEQSVELTVLAPPVYTISDPEFIDRTNWKVPGYTSANNDAQIGYSSQHFSDGGGVMAMFDGNEGSYWHTRYGSPATDYPHWFIVDLGELTEIGGVTYRGRTNDNRGSTGFQLFTTDMDFSDNLSALSVASIWESCGRFTHPETGSTRSNFPILPPYPKARYIKVYFGVEYKGTGDNVMISEFGLFRPRVNAEP